ncbi:MAG: PAS domain S-box protein [Alphaproteobacteria bacterium]|nr:PAS domain S-box protein [Alphaproteobacteria bacterium]
MLDMKPQLQKQPSVQELSLAAATAVPSIRWITRGLLACGILAVVGIFTVFLSLVAPEITSPLVYGPLFVLAVTSAGSALWILIQARNHAQQEILLREAFHSVLIPQAITDESGNAVLANRAFIGWIDISDQNAEDALAGRFADNQAAAAEFKQLQKTARAGQMAVAELPVMRNGRMVEWRRITVRQLTGWPNYLQWRLEDVSERRRMERAMREEQAKLVDFMANAPVGIYSVDQHGRFRFVNRTLAEWLGSSAEELISNNVRLHDVINAPSKEIAPHAIVPGMEGERRGEVVMTSKDGRLLPVAITQTVVTNDDGKMLRTRSIVRDLTPEREWQEALLQSEQRFQRLFAQAPIGVALVDMNLNVMECNQALVSLLRRTREALINLPLTELIRSDSRDAAETQLRDVLGGRDFVKPLEVHLIADRDVAVLIYVKRFDAPALTRQGTDPNVTEGGLVLYFIDTTEQKRLEVQFAQSQKMQAIGQLAGGIAHDFNNLLTAMIGFCDLLLQRHKPGDQSFADIMQIKQNGSRAANLVRQLLAFSRQQTLQPKVLSMVDVLAELSNLLRRLIGPTIRLEMVHGRDLAPVKVDQMQLEQVIVNLVVNARDAMPQGGAITVKTSNHKQAVGILRRQDEMPAGQYVLIEVSDTGTGIPKEIQQRIFEPFFSTKEVGHGTGLGLSTVYGIVRQTGGFINLESEVGRGTKFMVYLPAHIRDGKAVEEAAVEEAPEKAADLTGSGNILLVEDEDAVRIFSSRALRNKGYNVIEARNGEEALAVIEKEGKTLELMISDVVMPQMDGPTLYSKIKDDWPKLKVIFISGYAEDKFRDQLKAGEVVYFLGKPFTLKQLASKVKDVLDGNE